MHDNLKNSWVARTLFIIVISILVLVPFHGFLTTWVASNTGWLLIWRVWKEILLILATVLATILLFKDVELCNKIFKSRFVQLIGFFIFWQLFSATLMSRDLDALILGLAIQLRLFVFFIIVAIATYYNRPSKKLLSFIVLIPAGLVVGFGLLQMFILPFDFLKHFGYQKNITISPFFTIDSQLDKLRIASTLRGPNPLGVYLILPLLIVIESWNVEASAWFRKQKPTSIKKVLFWSCVLLAGLIVLYGSHSRGAWLGFVAALITYGMLRFSRKLRSVFIVGVLGISVVAGFGVYQFRSSTFVQDVVLHDNPVEGGEVSSNQGHVEALRAGVTNIKKYPIAGCGPGCAGPASVHNKAGVKISENYFIQTAEETGIIGLALLLVLFISVSVLLLCSPDPRAQILLATFVGINVASLLAHSWADDTTAYLWWGIAAMVIYSSKQVRASVNTSKSTKRE